MKSSNHHGVVPQPAQAIDEEEVGTLPKHFFNRADLYCDSDAYVSRVDDLDVRTTWDEYRTQVRLAARGLVALGVERGANVCIYSKSRPVHTVLLSLWSGWV